MKKINHDKNELLLRKRKVLTAVLSIVFMVIFLFITYFIYLYVNDEWTNSKTMLLPVFFVLLTTSFLITFMIGRINSEIKNN